MISPRVVEQNLCKFSVLMAQASIRNVVVASVTCDLGGSFEVV